MRLVKEFRRDTSVALAKQGTEAGDSIIGVLLRSLGSRPHRSHLDDHSLIRNRSGCTRDMHVYGSLEIQPPNTWD